MKRHLLPPNLVGQTEESIQAIIDLREEIIREGNLAVKHAEKSISHICAAGNMLIELKEKVGHGNFRKELDAIRMKKSTAHNYMQVARYVQRGGHLEGGGLRDALKLITKGDAATIESNPDAPPPEYRTCKPNPKPKASGVMIDAEIVDAPSPSPSIDDDDQPLVVDESKPASTLKKRFKVIESNGLAIYASAKCVMDTLSPKDTQKVEALTSMISYCQSRLDKKTDVLAVTLATVPRLTAEERATLIETLNSQKP